MNETELVKVKAEITALEKKLLTLHQGPQDRRALEKIIEHEKKLNDLQMVEKRLKSLVRKEAVITQIAELQAKVDEWHQKISKVHEEITVFARHIKEDPLLDEIAGKFGLRVFNDAKALFNRIDNLSARIQHNLSEIQRLSPDS